MSNDSSTFLTAVDSLMTANFMIHTIKKILLYWLFEL